MPGRVIKPGKPDKAEYGKGAWKYGLGKKLIEYYNSNQGAVIGALIGLVIGIAFWFWIFKVLLIVLCAVLGFYIGKKCK